MHIVPQPLENALAAKYRQVRSGLAVGFASQAAMERLRSVAGGVWMASANGEELPFEDGQFEVVVLDPGSVTREMVREANRVLTAGGSLFFMVNEKTRSVEGYTAPEVYRLVREGFDILSVARPRWWQFGAARTLTVCARKKAWREHRSLARDGVYIFEPFAKFANK